MEKKVNLTIFFNYRNYSPRYKALLEDVFYKKMHDEKLGSSETMKEVMQFCSDVDHIENRKLEDEKVLSRYDKNEKTIVINSDSIATLLEEHKDLDEEALLKNIFGKQIQNVLAISEDSVFDITFEDILNKNGYVTPRSLTELQKNGESLSSESVINEILGSKYAAKNTETEISDFDKTAESIESNDNMKSTSFAAFNYDETNSYESKVPSIRRYSDIGDDYDVVDCVRRKDNNSTIGSFSDFVNESKKDVDYTLEDEENYGDLKKHKKKKSGRNLFGGIKEKMSSLKEKVFAKRDGYPGDEYYDESDNTEQFNPEVDYFKDFNYLDEKAKAEKKDDIKIYEKSKENVNVENDLKSEATNIIDNFDYSEKESDIDADNKFDSIIEAIMKEKREKEYTNNYDASDNVQNASEEPYNADSDLGKVEEKNEKNSTIYDAFAEELETVESIRRRRRK